MALNWLWCSSMNRNREFAKTIIRRNRRQAEKDLKGGDRVLTRIIEDNTKAIRKTESDFKSEIIDQKRDIVIELHKKGIPVYNIMQQTGLSSHTVSTIISVYMTANRPENLITELMKKSIYQHKPRANGECPKHLFDFEGIYEATKDDISLTKQETIDYIISVSEDVAKRRSNQIRDIIREKESKLKIKSRLSYRDLEQIAKQVDTHHEIVELEYQSLGGRGDGTKLAAIAKKYKLHPSCVFELDRHFKDSANKTKYGINYIRIAMKLETKLSLDEIVTIHRTEYQQPNSELGSQ